MPKLVFDLKRPLAPANVQSAGRRPDPVWGSFIFLPSPAVVEIFGYAGADFVIIDREHCAPNWENVENMVRAAELTCMLPLVRVARNDKADILHALEVGAGGVMVPFIEDASDVRRAADALLYPPHGRRGTCTQTRAARYGANRANFVQYAQEVNGRVLLVGLIESRRGVENIEQILDVRPGLDVLFIGRSDLASDYGAAGQVSDPRVESATQRLIDAALAAGVRVGIAVYSAKECEFWAARGCTMLALPSEASLLHDAVAGLRSDVDQRLSRLGNGKGKN